MFKYSKFGDSEVIEQSVGQQGMAMSDTPSIEAAYEMGSKGGTVVEAERLAFEAWMRGHCWPLGAHWTGEQYVSDEETAGFVSIQAMVTRRMWAAWRGKPQRWRSARRARRCAMSRPICITRPMQGTALRQYGCALTCKLTRRALAPVRRLKGAKVERRVRG